MTPHWLGAQFDSDPTEHSCVGGRMFLSLRFAASGAVSTTIHRAVDDLHSTSGTDRRNGGRCYQLKMPKNSDPPPPERPVWRRGRGAVSWRGGGTSTAATASTGSGSGVAGVKYDLV